MPEEPVVTTLASIRNRALLIAGIAALSIIVSVASLLSFSVQARKSRQAENAKPAAELDEGSVEPRPRAASRSVEPSSSEPERLAVLESRKAGCLAMIDATTRKLQQSLEVANDREHALRSLETNDIGRQIAANEDLVEMFLALREAQLPPIAGIDETQVVLDGLQTKLQLFRSGVDLERVEQMRIELEQLSESALRTLDQMTHAKRDLDALMLLAEREIANSLSLGEVADRYELQITADHQLKITKARRLVHEEQQAEEQAKAAEFNREIATLRSEMSDSQRRIQFAEENAKRELAKRAEAKRKLEIEFQRDLPDIKSLLKPFITPGLTQHLHKFAYRPDRNPNPRPVSFGSLVALGYLHDSTERLTAFWRSTSHENDRPFGSFPRAPYGKTVISHELSTVRRAQSYLKKYGELMVEKGLLSP